LSIIVTRGGHGVPPLQFIMNNDDFTETFKQLKAIFKPYASKLHVVHDTDTNYYLDTHLVMKNKQRLFFGAVRTGKAYVSFHLMPVYASPELLKTLSPELKKRMQGKSCFNFKTPDEKLFKELAKLTKTGFAKFHDPKFLEKILPR
jgi:pentose-5-phosphate-3-epimerase